MLLPHAYHWPINNDHKALKSQSRRSLQLHGVTLKDPHIKKGYSNRIPSAIVGWSLEMRQVPLGVSPEYRKKWMQKMHLHQFPKGKASQALVRKVRLGPQSRKITLQSWFWVPIILDSRNFADSLKKEDTSKASEQLQHKCYQFSSITRELNSK